MKKMIIATLGLLLLAGCTTNLGGWLDKHIGNNDGKYDGPTITATKTLSDGTPITIGIGSDGGLILDIPYTNAAGAVFSIVDDGELTFTHSGITYHVDMFPQAATETGTDE